MNGHRSVLPSGSSIWAAGHPRRVVLLPGLSRMKGNLHVRFLEGGGLATAHLYSARLRVGKTGNFLREGGAKTQNKVINHTDTEAQRGPGRGRQDFLKH